MTEIKKLIYERISYISKQKLEALETYINAEGEIEAMLAERCVAIDIEMIFLNKLIESVKSEN